MQKLIGAMEKMVWIGALPQMENSLKVTEVETRKNKYTIFINTGGFGSPSYVGHD